MGYSKTGPFVNGSSPGISAAFLNNLENVLVQPSGGTETGRYFIGMTPPASGSLCPCYIPTLSRGSTVLSVTIDTVDSNAGTGGGTPPTNRLTNGGFLVYTSSSGSGTGNNVNVGGNYTASF